MTVALSDECRAAGETALLARDWRAAYDTAKYWVSQAGGAWTPEAWLLYAASGVLHGQPRIAVRSVDLALGNWVQADLDRAVLHWARAVITWSYLDDPKTALPDLEASAAYAPDWLRSRVDDDLRGCREAARVSRKRKRSVDEAPVYSGKGVAHETVASAEPGHVVGSRPLLWDPLAALLSGDGRT